MKKYLNYYNACHSAGYLVKIGTKTISNGLCYGLQYDEALGMFEPTKEDCDLYEVDRAWYWGNELQGEFNTGNDGVFTPLRQNVVLFLAAMHDEL